MNKRKAKRKRRKIQQYRKKETAKKHAQPKKRAAQRTKSWKAKLPHPKLNRQYKDKVFRLAFKNKKDALALYNALNNTDYQDEDALEITTLEDAVYLSVKNDVSFLVGGMMNLYEHQSSYNPNMPARGLIYFARLYEQYIESRGLNIYSSTLQKLPVPNYIIFYNGTQEEPDSRTLRLSDAFDLTNVNQKPCLECTATMLNINYGHNRELMDKCQRLKEYSLFVEIVRKHCQNEKDRNRAVSGAVEECIQKDILKDILLKNRAEVMNVVLACTREKYEKMVRDEEFERGRCEGRREGRREGKSYGIALARKVFRLSQQSLTCEQIAAQCNLSSKEVKKILE